VDYLSSDKDNEGTPEWFKKRRSPSKDPFISDIDEMFKEMERMMDEELKDFTNKVPKYFRCLIGIVLCTVLKPKNFYNYE
jgi:hypothetical protein